MSAESNRSTVYALRTEIIDHLKEQSPLDLITLLNLVPLFTEDTQSIINRGEFKFSGNNFSNVGEEVWIAFHDMAIGDYFVTIPANWNGTISVSGDVIEIDFISEILLEIPELANLGVDRNSFQKLTTIKSTKETTISVLIDNDSVDKETWIDAVLIPEASTTQFYPQYELKSLEKFDTSSNSCGQDTTDANWYVYKRNDGLCFTHHGEWIEGGSIAYTKIYGPATQSDCDAYERQNCP